MDIKTGIEFILSLLDRFPSWFRGPVMTLIGILIILWLLLQIFKILHDQIFRDSILLTQKKGRSLFKGAVDALKSPIERPRTKLVFAGLGLIHTYLMVLIFLSLALGTVASMFLYTPGFSVLTIIVMIGVFLLFLYLTMFARVEADKEYLELKGLWEKYKGK